MKPRVASIMKPPLLAVPICIGGEPMAMICGASGIVRQGEC
jgi:hypothetical protein